MLLIEPGTPGAGVAYGAARPWHLLNSRAGAMSADPDDPGHFVTWLRGRGIAAGPDDFVSRRHFGRYLYASLEAAACAYPGRLRLFDSPVARVATGPDGPALVLADGRLLRADRAVLAVGGSGGGQPAGLTEAGRSHPGYVADPWAPRALDAIPRGARVLLLGTGLTAIDVMLSLVEAGHGGPVTAVSRHGLLPRAHGAAGPPVTLPHQTRLRPLMRQLRVAAAAHGDWRPVVDGLRPHLDALWTGFSAEEQDRFLRHVARHWEVHRHRMAPAVADRVEALRASGDLTVRAGRPARIEPAGPGLLVTFADGHQERYGAVVACTGSCRLPEAAGPLLTTLLGDGLVRPGPHGLGLDVDAAGRLRDAAGRVNPRLWTVGPLRRGALWETTAVPEIRAQARALAEQLRTVGERMEERPARPAIVAVNQLAA
ncbi:FAD/NAD(P)-binding protein [Luedemannella helvata]|uniref:FAD/NAD(P)-binding protein n=1 Tax=Luedemannella helvata TaxID=349315 RepID=A0ABN2L088_9ACTN